MKKIILLSLLFGSIAAPLNAKQIGTSPSALPLSLDRIKNINPKDKKLWEAYLLESEKGYDLNKTTLLSEMKSVEVIPPSPPVAKQETMPLNMEDAWYKTAEAIKVADNIISFQTPAGGWGKNQARDKEARLKGQSFIITDVNLNDTPENIVPKIMHYMGTFDNDATISELRFLAKIINNNKDNAKYIESFKKGLNYTLKAQYPNGGFPQVYPLEGGYHDSITYNDNAMIAIIEFMTEIVKTKDYSFIDNSEKQKINIAISKSLECILKSQVIINGKKTIWGQQYDVLDLTPTSARNYEPISLSSSESGGILIYLMKIPTPDTRIKSAIKDGIDWLRTHSISNKSYERVGDEGKRLIDKPNAPLIWSRFYSIETQTPIFGDRGKEIFDDINDVSGGRRNGYSWFNSTAGKAIKYYDDVWSKQN